MPPLHTATPRAKGSEARRASRTWSEAVSVRLVRSRPGRAASDQERPSARVRPSLELEPAAGDEILDGLRDEHRVLLPSPPARQYSTNEAVVPFNELLPSGLGDVHRLILGAADPRRNRPLLLGSRLPAVMLRCPVHTARVSGADSATRSRGARRGALALPLRGLLTYATRLRSSSTPVARCRTYGLGPRVR